MEVLGPYSFTPFCSYAFLKNSNATKNLFQNVELLWVQFTVHIIVALGMLHYTLLIVNSNQDPVMYIAIQILASFSVDYSMKIWLEWCLSSVQEIL